MKASDGTDTQVDAQMINKCKAEMREEELYNVMKSLKEKDEKILYEELKKQKYTEKSILVFLFFCNNAVHVSNRIDSLRLSSLTHPLRIFIVGCALGQGLENRATTDIILFLKQSIFSLYFSNFGTNKIFKLQISHFFNEIIMIIKT